MPARCSTGQVCGSAAVTAGFALVRDVRSPDRWHASLRFPPRPQGHAMSLFGSILEKLGLRTSSIATAPGTPAPRTTAAPAAPAAPTAMAEVDVVAKLDGLAAANPQKLNWKVSIVDLLKLLSLDSSFEARKGLATELGCPADKMGDSAQMNMWLHKTVLAKLAENGGNVPKELLH
jgi:hypothetical protein